MFSTFLIVALKVYLVVQTKKKIFVMLAAIMKNPSELIYILTVAFPDVQALNMFLLLAYILLYCIQALTVDNVAELAHTVLFEIQLKELFKIVQYLYSGARWCFGLLVNVLKRLMLWNSDGNIVRLNPRAAQL